MERRDILVSGLTAGFLTTAGGLVWRGTQNNLAVEVINHTDENSEVSLSVSKPTDELVYNETFAISNGSSITRYNVADAGEYKAILRVGGREQIHEFNQRFCHSPRIVFEIEGGVSLASYSTC